jgi:hypothetical protein
MARLFFACAFRNARPAVSPRHLWLSEPARQKNRGCNARETGPF